ncbi:MAG: hypothetical protein K2W86_02575 [Sphingomonas sp.]|uniref:hypothetical protein n=1 Tax=Sphingomonas sp. TaxID=28214 RepID=UPI0035A92C1A|nr:hypothetical protein [Sphingomonas sp.]
MVARIATGEIDEKIDIFGANKGRAAGGNARAATLLPEVRKQIASDAAKARWSQRETGSTMTHATTQGAAADRREAVRMYPNNSLLEPVRGYSNKLAEVVRSTFTK